MMAHRKAPTRIQAIPSKEPPEQTHRSSSLPISIDGTLSASEQAAAASLRARDSQTEYRAYAFWCRMGRPAAVFREPAPPAQSDRRSPSPRSVAFDLGPTVDGEDVLFALEP